MGIISSIASWVSDGMIKVTKIAKRAAEVVYRGADYIEKLMKGKTLLEEIEEKREPKIYRRDLKRIYVVGSDNPTEQVGDEFSQLFSKIDEGRKKLISVERDNNTEHHRIKLQIDMMELMISAQTVERFTNNIHIHASNLQIHLHTIQNTAGLLDDVNRQRRAVKALMKTVNHLINVTGAASKVEPIEGVDIDMKKGNISIHGAYIAFENTKDLLLKEVECYKHSLEEQLHRLEDIRVASRKTPKLMKKINNWVTQEIEPSLMHARKEASALEADLVVIPKLELDLQRELKEI